MRIMTMEFVESLATQSLDEVEKNITIYNSLPTTEVKAKRNGTRRTRYPDEQRVLDNFKLK